MAEILESLPLVYVYVCLYMYVSIHVFMYACNEFFDINFVYSFTFTATSLN